MLLECVSCATTSPTSQTPRGIAEVPLRPCCLIFRQIQPLPRLQWRLRSGGVFGGLFRASNTLHTIDYSTTEGFRGF
jgi:hypothetical protein